jgi:hypothetical protein
MYVDRIACAECNTNLGSVIAPLPGERIKNLLFYANGKRRNAASLIACPRHSPNGVVRVGFIASRMSKLGVGEIGKFESGGRVGRVYVVRENVPELALSVHIDTPSEIRAGYRLNLLRVIGQL